MNLYFSFVICQYQNIFMDQLHYGNNNGAMMTSLGGSGGGKCCIIS